jgi:hypothetical protein
VGRDANTVVDAGHRGTRDQGAARRSGSSLAALLAYLVLAVAVTWPLARHLDAALPLGTEPVATVPLFNLWTLWWNADRALHLGVDYWDAPIFFPAESAFAFSEAQPTTVVVAPLVWASQTPAVAYNVYLLAALALNGLASFRLLRRLALGVLPAALGGAMVELLPFVHWQLGVLQLVPVFGIVWTIHALVDFGEGPSLPRAVALGLAFAITYLLCNHHGLFLSVLLLAAGGWLLGWELLRWRTWLRLLVAIVLALIVVAPVVRVQWRVAQEYRWERSSDAVADLSATWSDYTRSPWPPPEPARTPPASARGNVFPLHPGTVMGVLAVGGLAWGLSRRRHRRVAAFGLTLAGAAIALSLGPQLRVGPVVPYELLAGHYPGFEHIRNAHRFALFAQLAIAVLAALGLEAVAVALGRRSSSRGRGIAVAVLGAAAVFEIWPPPQPLYFLPDAEAGRRWVAWLEAETPPGSPIVCVPFARGGRARDTLETALWMYWGTQHRRPLLNGYSGFFPPPAVRLQTAMKAFPDARSLRLLRKRGARYAVVRRVVARREAIAGDAKLASRLHWVFGDDRAGLDVYAIE